MNWKQYSVLVWLVVLSTTATAQLSTTLILTAPTLPEAVYSPGGTKKTLQPFVYTHEKTHTLHAVWKEPLSYNGKLKADSFKLYYAQSGDTGKTWPVSKPAFYAPNVLKNPVCCVGAKGEVYILWMDKDSLNFQRSTDNGTTWLPAGKKIAGALRRLKYDPPGSPDTGPLTLVCDLSNSSYAGRIYACWAGNKYNTNADVFLIYSDDAGTTWTEPILVTYRPNHKDQFMPELAIDKNGVVNIVYYDQQNSADRAYMDIYLAQSKNGGLKFEYYKINVNPVISSVTHYKLLSSYPLTLTWKEGLTRYEAALTDEALAAYTTTYAKSEIRMARTFTFSNKIKVDFTISDSSRVSAVITKPLEPGFEKWIVKDKKFKKGNNTLLIDTKAAGLKKGNYTLTLYYNNRNTYTWIVD